ncbi:MAG TPA: ElyC/SanA/YdcF family protein [Kineosporiaceae bacterium]|nr:ElyC/SanA/YdcF family protein [Kineosporiaceae bacterium]
MTTPAPGRLRRAGARRLLIVSVLVVVISLLGAWLAAASRWIGHPRLDRPTRADAVIVLGPQDPDGGFALGERLVDQGVAGDLLLSVSSSQRGPVGHTCGGERSRPAVTVTCFVPDPGTTRGEARELARQAEAHGWRTVIVITPAYHVERARMIFKRCFAGRVDMVAPPISISSLTWAYQYLYQSAGFAKASAERGC